ncbi:MAG: filamentous hemagglutinin N-terminal domain-containing protein [Burkholderiaceae bacterium]|nr:filamentous hemagglutinin N-terminal domain-containing protein [Burkholderiaceae bacterium]
MSKRVGRALAGGFLAGMALSAWAAGGVVVHGNSATQVSTGADGKVNVIPAAATSGVSYNGFDRFDVGAAGLAFQNSDVRARTLVGEVFSAAPSRIEGPVEVIGPRANFILANQNGITVNGGSFVNFGSVALTTGSVALRDQAVAPGQVQRYVDVSTHQGQITVGADGLSGDLIRLEMIAKNIDIQGPVSNTYSSPTATARLIVGDSLAQFDTLASPTDNLTPWVYYTPGQASSSAVALNVGVGSSVTAGQIQILVTDQGAGVRNAGQMVASAGDFKLTSTGLLEQTGGKIQSLGRADIQVGDLKQQNSGDGAPSMVSAGTSVHVQASGDIRNLGGEISGNARDTADTDVPYAVLLQAGGVIQNATPVGAPQTALIFGNADDVALHAGADVLSTNARVISNADLTIQAGARARNESLHDDGASQNQWSSGGVFTHGNGYQVNDGSLSDPANQAYWVAQGSVHIQAGSVQNVGGFVYANGGNVTIDAADQALTQAVSIGGYQYSRKCFLFICHATASSDEALVGGQILAAQEVQIKAGNSIVNDAGQVYGTQGMTLDAPAILAQGRAVHTAIARDRGLKALLGDTWAQVYATDQGGSFTAQDGQMILRGAAVQDRGVFQAGGGIEGRITVIQTPQRDPVRLLDHLGILWW